jgi:hypothetical protein
MHHWYYRDPQSRKIGPLSEDEFEERVADGEIQPTTRVWHPGLADWTTYEALLAQEAGGRLATTGPATSFAPVSSSYRTLIALGSSAVHRPPTRSCIVTPAATPRGLRVPCFDLCQSCGEEVPAHLIRIVGQRRLCGFCSRKAAAQARRERLRAARREDANWIGRLLVHGAIIAALFTVGRVVVSELHHGPAAVSAPPVVAASSGLPANIPLRPTAAR